MFTSTETKELNIAIDMYIASNKRMRNSKPAFAEIFDAIDRDLMQIKAKINAQTTKNK